MIDKGNWWAGVMADRRPRILLLAGTEEAVRLSQILEDWEDVSVLSSLAGRTRDPVRLNGEVITGGFGGQNGLEDFLKQRSITHIIDATHPFAAQITNSAIKASEAQEIDYLRLERPAWTEASADIWIRVRNVTEAASKLGAFRTVFLSIGRQELDGFRDVQGKRFLVRSIEPVAFTPSGSTVTFLQARGPFSLEAELGLLKDQQIDVLVSKNSGGTATYAKIEAARKLSLPVIMIERPKRPDCQTFGDIDSLLQAFRLGRRT